MAASRFLAGFATCLDGDNQPTRCVMRAFSLRSVLCLTVLTLTTSAFAGVRGKPAAVKEPVAASRRVAQNDADYSINAVPVPGDVRVTNERVIQETRTNAPMPTRDQNCPPLAPAQAQGNFVAVPVMAMPMMAPVMQPMPMQPMMPMPMMGAPGCASCGGMPRGLSPSAAALYDESFGPGLYRSGAEAGQFHFPYYSYRRPWYFPGQPSFQRSTDHVW